MTLKPLRHILQKRRQKGTDVIQYPATTLVQYYYRAQLILLVKREITYSITMQCLNPELPLPTNNNNVNIGKA
jgi:hypothetical protein